MPALFTYQKGALSTFHVSSKFLDALLASQESTLFTFIHFIGTIQPSTSVFFTLVAFLHILSGLFAFFAFHRRIPMVCLESGSVLQFFLVRTPEKTKAR